MILSSLFDAVTRRLQAGEGGIDGNSQVTSTPLQPSQFQPPFILLGTGCLSLAMDGNFGARVSDLAEQFLNGCIRIRAHFVQRDFCT